MSDESRPITPEIVTEDDEQPKGDLVPQSNKPDILYLVPITGRPHLPAQVQPLMVSKKRWEETIVKASKDSKNLLGLSYLSEVNGKYVYKKDFPEMGCVVRMLNIVDVEGNIQFIAQGLERFKIKKFLSDKPPFVAQVEYLKKSDEDEDELKAYAISIISAIKQLLSLNPLYSEDLKQYLGRFSPDQPSPLTDFAAGITTADGDTLQEILETESILARMKKVMMLLKKEIEIAKLQTKIQKDINTQVDDNKESSFSRNSSRPFKKNWAWPRMTKLRMWINSRRGLPSSILRSMWSNGLMRRLKSFPCWRPAPPNTASPETIWTGSPLFPGGDLRG